MELQADYAVKLQAGGELTDRDLREITAVPHPNEHIRLMGPVSYAIFRCLLPRPVQIARIDAPLFVTCDEPVLVDNDSHVKHVPDCHTPRGELRRRRRRATSDGTTYEQHVHIWPTRPAGVQVADAIAMPLTPSALLVLGRAGEQPVPEVFLRGDDARELADDVNAAMIGQAYEWVATRPDHPTFRDFTFPAPGPLIGVRDGGSIMSQQLNSAPPHRWQRLRRDWPDMPGTRTADSLRWRCRQVNRQLTWIRSTSQSAVSNGPVTPAQVAQRLGREDLADHPARFSACFIFPGATPGSGMNYDRGGLPKCPVDLIAQE